MKQVIVVTGASSGLQSRMKRAFDSGTGPEALSSMPPQIQPEMQAAMAELAARTRGSWYTLAELIVRG